MRTSRPSAVALAALLTGALAACSSSTAGSGQAASTSSSGTAAASTSSSASASGSAAPAGSGSSAAPSSAPAAGASDAKSLFTLLQAGVASVHSLHISVSTSAADTNVVVTGDEQLAHTKITGLDLHESLGPQSFRIVYVGGKTYVQLPAQLRQSARPYSLVSASSKNPAIRAFGSALSSTLTNSSLNSYSLLAQAASSVRRVGPVPISGVATTRYSIVVDFTRLPADYPNRAALQASGLTRVPVELYVDSHGRPVEITEKFAVSGRSVAVKLLASRYNQPVHIAAPPKSQVDTTK